MFLKSLSMKGFKSFADPTVLEFEPGITVVVGPNGSGKSNVVDAVTWVLGAQGPRSLRSQKMEDVIFAGTSSRPALGRAEVSLTIDNGSGRLPVDMAEVTITRTLFRSGDSEYAINGTACRLLDIQDLLSDSGVGRQQHMIVGQGQLDTVLNARPEDRRSIIEEAAGVLKHRRRRERAERRLEGTGENLERLGDLVREVRRQIRPLERQAAAARSHAKLGAELRAVRMHVAGQELAQLGSRRDAATEHLAALSGEEGALRSSLAELDRQATAAAAELSSRRGEDLASSLGRLQGLVERARGLGGVLRERSRATAAALDAAADLDVVSTLESEGASLAEELASAGEEELALGPELAGLERGEEELARDERAHRDEWGDGSERQVAEEALGLARGRLDLLRRSEGQARSALDGAEARAGSLGRRAEALAASAEDLAARGEAMAAESARLGEEVVASEAAAAEALAAAQGSEHAAAEAEQARHRTAARAEALARALEELHGAGGSELLRDVDGVVGTLVDLVEIDEGWERAFEAAVGAAVAAVVVQGRTAAREALSRLRRQGVTGAVLAARGAGAGERRFEPTGTAPPAGAEPLRPHVRARPSSGGDAGTDLSQVLDALVATAVRVAGWEQAIDLALDRPDLVVVTVEGDRFASTGWRVRSGQGVVTAAAVEEAEHRAAAAAAAADRVAARLAEDRRALDDARRRSADATRRADRHASASAASEQDRRRNEADRARVLAELQEAGGERDAARARLASDVDAVRAVEQAIPGLAEAAALASERAAQAASAWGLLDERRARLRALRQELHARRAGLAERRRVLEQRLAEVERRLEGHAEEREEAAARRRRLQADGRALVRLDEVVGEEGARLQAVLASLQRDYRDQVEAVRAGGERLEVLRRDRAAAERRLAEVGEKSRGLQLEVAEVALRSDALSESVRRELGADPVDLAGAEAPELPEGVAAADHAASLAERLAALGPVNPLALDELSSLEERQHELDEQMEDVRSARRELQGVIRSLDDEIMHSFTAAAADVNEHFSSLVAMLFPGGTGRLVLTEPDDLLNTGVEVEVRPAGRNVRRVSLLSGGERSLAALAFLFAVFRSRPSPFYLMDEVEAALDDVNLTRFLGLVKEFRDEAQLIIVSHQKRTMETGDALYGVTMAPGGSSQAISQRVERRREASAPT